MRFLLPAAILAIAFALPAKAQDYNTLLDIPEGATLVNLSATEMLEVDQDLLVATLRFEAKNKDPKKLQDDINEVMKKALDKAKSVPDVKVATQQYYVYPQDYDPNPQPLEKGEAPRKLERIWYGQQGIEIKGKKADDLLKLTGELQLMGLAITGLQYTISPELLEQTQESMLEAALTKLKAKAERTAKALGKSQTELLQVNVDIGGYYPAPMMARGMAMDAGMEMAKMDAPVAAPGQSQINLTVNAQALLRK
jgi:predicted secreted protein